MKLEKQVQKEILNYLISIKCYAIKVQVSNRIGVVDIYGVFNGVPFCIEVKAEDKGIKNLTRHQKNELMKFNNAGGFGFMSNSFEHTKVIFEHFLKY